MNSFKYKLQYSSTFKRDYKRCVKQGLDMTKLHDVIEQLAIGKQLSEKHKTIYWLETGKGIVSAM